MFKLLSGWFKFVNGQIVTKYRIIKMLNNTVLTFFYHNITVFLKAYNTHFMHYNLIINKEMLNIIFCLKAKKINKFKLVIKLYLVEP